MLIIFEAFNTTKGVLVRSMLFPKPIGFKFYRDSIRFILVLAGLAGLGFCASAVQFVRLGVRVYLRFMKSHDLNTPGKMAHNYASRPGPHYRRRPACPPCNPFNRNKLFHRATTEARHFLHLPK